MGIRKIGEDLSPVRPCKVSPNLERNNKLYNICIHFTCKETYTNSTKTIAYSAARDYINTILGMLKLLHHRNQCRPCITFFIHTCQVIVHFNHILQSTKIKQIINKYQFDLWTTKINKMLAKTYIMITLSHIIHDAFEPLERALLSSHPIKICSPRAIALCVVCLFLVQTLHALRPLL
jgi:hypothetical protein